MAAMKKKAIEEMFRRFAAATPEPRGELFYTNPYTLLVAGVLSAQATDAGVSGTPTVLLDGVLFEDGDSAEDRARNLLAAFS